MSLGNDAAARGWAARAAELVEEFQLTSMRGWVLLCRAYLANDDAQPRVAERCAREALAPCPRWWRRRSDPLCDV